MSIELEKFIEDAKIENIQVSTKGMLELTLHYISENHWHIFLKNTLSDEYIFKYYNIEDGGVFPILQSLGYFN